MDSGASSSRAKAEPRETDCALGVSEEAKAPSSEEIESASLLHGSHDVSTHRRAQEVATPPLRMQMLTKEGDDLEAGDGEEEQPQCRICLEAGAGRDFITPCRCKGSAQFVHRECLDQWRSVKEGFAFCHCTTCKMQYHIRVHAPLDARWRTAKFRFLVTRDAIAISLLVQLIIMVLAYGVYAVDSGLCNSALKHSFGVDSSIPFYYVCGLVLFFALAGVLGCVLTCIDQQFRTDIGRPCRELCNCCSAPLVFGDCNCCGPCCMYADWNGCAACCDCVAGGGAGEATALFCVVAGIVIVVVFVIVGILYSLVVAMVVAQRIWQRHYHILAKRMLTKEYVVEDLSGVDLPPNWVPPPLPQEHEKQLRDLGLL